MKNASLILFGKIFSVTTKKLNLGNGSTWPGHIALKLNNNFIRDILKASSMKVIIVAGTNGKTTTSKLISTILEKNDKKVIHNSSGANLLNGIASSLLLHSGIFSKLNYDYAIFEVDENTLPLVLNEITPDYLIILNLFRDQLDRYGEINIIAEKWRKTVNKLSEKTILILNADDPQVAYTGSNTEAKAKYFSCDNRSNNNKKSHDVDSTYCPKCGEKLIFKLTTFSHLGDWSCTKCDLRRPSMDLNKSPIYPLPGLYNYYNTNAAVLFSISEQIDEKNIRNALMQFKPAFGRQEELLASGKKVKIFLSKNPTGFNESLRTVKQLGGETLLFVLNDRIPDGKDVSWIWDTDIEGILDGKEKIIISGDRVYDMALRVKYAHKSEVGSRKSEVFERLEDAINKGLDLTSKDQTLYIIPTYTAMLEVRKILTGKKIL